LKQCVSIAMKNREYKRKVKIILKQTQNEL
jgi:hypothetical protein